MDKKKKKSEKSLEQFHTHFKHFIWKWLLHEEEVVKQHLGTLKFILKPFPEATIGPLLMFETLRIIKHIHKVTFSSFSGNELLRTWTFMVYEWNIGFGLVSSVKTGLTFHTRAKAFLAHVHSPASNQTW